MYQMFGGKMEANKKRKSPPQKNQTCVYNNVFIWIIKYGFEIEDGQKIETYTISQVSLP